jgi:hypothetical protein
MVSVNVRGSSMLTQKLLWARGGSGPELSGPHSLFETAFDGDAKNWLTDPKACKTILSHLNSDALGKQPTELQQLSIFEAFASVTILLQRRAGNPVENFRIVPREPHLSWVAIEHIWAPTAKLAAGLATQFIQIMNGTRLASGDQIAEWERRWKTRPR